MNAKSWACRSRCRCFSLIPLIWFASKEFCLSASFSSSLNFGSYLFFHGIQRFANDSCSAQYAMFFKGLYLIRQSILITVKEVDWMTKRRSEFSECVHFVFLSRVIVQCQFGLRRHTGTQMPAHSRQSNAKNESTTKYLFWNYSAANDWPVCEKHKMKLDGNNEWKWN